MKTKDIELFNISRFRAEHMGAAMIMVILFHVALPRTDAFYGLRRMGNIGVDIFLFLSGIGLWFSWARNTHKGSMMRDWVKFYWRRLVRIYPAWIVVAGGFYVWQYLNHGRFSADITDLLGDVLINWDFWLHDEGTFWYIPATMMLYIFAPPYMELIRRHPIYRWLVALMMMWCVIVQYVTPIHHALGHIEIFWSRIPVFLLGINIAESVRRKDTIDGQSIWLILIAFIVSLSSCVWLEQVKHGHFPLFLERMLYIPLSITVILLLNYVFACAPKWFRSAFALIGTVSLEMYLIHIEYVLKPVQHYHPGYWPTFILTVAISLPMAYIVHKVIDVIVSKLKI